VKQLRTGVRKKSSDSSRKIVAQPDSGDDRAIPNVAESVEAVFGCKWSIRILNLIHNGVCRPGEIERALTGLTTKVQHHYFRRMLKLGIIRRDVFAEVPPRVEYRLTAFGERFVPLLHQIAQLQAELTRMAPGQSESDAST
jgi:DNA-binding HxlR family transcriptional regulator